MSHIITKGIIQEVNKELERDSKVYDLDLTDYWRRTAEVILHRRKGSNENSVVFDRYMTDNDVMNVFDSFCEEE